MDETLRELQRLAALGCPEAAEALAARARRLAGAGAEFQPPRQVPPLVADYSDPVLYRDQDLNDSWWTEGRKTRRYFKARAHRRLRGRVRSALRQVRPGEWEDWEG